MPDSEVALINMPWARCEAPSIQCGLLKAELRGHGVPADVHYLNIELASVIGARAYQGLATLAGERANLLGEWLFGVAAFGPRDDDDAYLELVGTRRICDALTLPADSLRRLRSEVLPAWIDQVSGQARWSDYAIIGFSSTFEQNVAALALARAIKEKHSGVQVVFGGANFEDEMGAEYVRAFPWIDYAVLGEGDIAFPMLVARILDGKDGSDVPGVCTVRNGSLQVPKQSAQVQNMDQLPVPDYDDYFRVLRKLGPDSAVAASTVHLPYESSRGCWWGEKHHCTFCGLNGMGMRYRSKSPELAVRQIAELIDRYHVTKIEAVDNILDMSYLSTFCAALAEAPWSASLFYEVKANLRPDQLRLLRAAGVTAIQPGIESLSNHVLSLMRKGSSLSINLRLLKWAQHYDIFAAWNILHGFPGETDADYKAQIELIPSLWHLRPPDMYSAVSLERFSPYFNDRSFPIHDVKPKAAYRYVYGSGVDLQKIAYFFDYSADGTASPTVRRELGTAVRAWQRKWADGKAPVFCYERGPSWLTLYDTRGSKPRRATLTGWRALTYEYCCQSARSAAGIADYLAKAGHEVCADRISRFVRSCIADRLMVADGERYFSLALPMQADYRSMAGGR
jgi:ribosomal peptide maturation radical SAM protein 1